MHQNDDLKPSTGFESFLSLSLASCFHSCIYEIYLSSVSSSTMLSQYLSPVVMATFMLRLVAAMPATFPVDPELANAIHQRDGQGMINGAPGCGTDPSYASGVSQFTDGEGVYIGSDCDNHLTTLPLKRFHCW